MSVAAAAILGAIGGLLVGSVGMGFLSFNLVKERARRGWNLVPVVVAATDLPRGTVVTLDLISQRQIPEQFVTSSVVRPESAAHVVNQKVLAPLQAGDPLLWSQLETMAKTALVAAADIPAGATLAEKDVTLQAVPEELLTESYVLARDRPQVIGRSVAAPFRRGDPILWTHFQATGSSAR
jgi:Flp pilus assembly protein CpaB